LPKDSEEGEAESVATGVAVPVPVKPTVSVGLVALDDTVRLPE
jgi:hypothetical protein